MTIYLKVLMNSKFINGCKCQISAIHMDIAKEKITSVSPQLALPYLLSILQPLWLHYPKSRCNKQVTIKKKRNEYEKKRWFKKFFLWPKLIFFTCNSTHQAAPGSNMTELSFLGRCVPQFCLSNFTGNAFVKKLLQT